MMSRNSVDEDSSSLGSERNCALALIAPSGEPVALLEPLVQSRVLDRDRSLGGEPSQELDLLGAERVPHAVVADAEEPVGLVAAAQGDAHRRLHRLEPRDDLAE